MLRRPVGADDGSGNLFSFLCQRRGAGIRFIVFLVAQLTAQFDTDFFVYVGGYPLSNEKLLI